MSEMTRRQIEQHCLVLRDALGNLFPSIDDPSREYYWELLDELGKAALSALTARSEGFREGVEAAAKMADIEETAASLCIGQLHGATMARDTAREIARAIRAISPRETDATRCSISFEHPPHDYCDGNPGAKPLNAPSGEVAEMVKRVEESAQYWLKGGRAETDRAKAAMFVEQAMNAYKNAMYALLAKVGQGWVPVRERLPEEGVSVLCECRHTRQGAWFIAVGRIQGKFADLPCWNVPGHNGDFGGISGEVTHWMPLPPPPERP